MKKFVLQYISLCILPFMFLSSCGETDDRLMVGVAFETLETEYWVASIEAIRDELEERNIRMLEAIADGDPNRQFEQINNFIARGVDGIICAPKDAQTVIPMIKAANRANIPFVSYNRPPAESEADAVTVVADNKQLAKETVLYLCEKAKEQGGTYKAMVVVGDLGDINAINRRDGFDAAVEEYPELVEVVSRVPSEWDLEKAKAGVTNAIQAHPEINFIFSSSDFLFPAIISALKSVDKYKKIGEEGHVFLGGFDGDATAYQMMMDGYLDATGVQDVYFECEQSVAAVLKMIEGQDVPQTILDPGFVIHQGNLEEMADRMWGANVAKEKAGSQG